MNWLASLARRFSSLPVSRPRRSPRGARGPRVGLTLERLEDRTTPAVAIAGQGTDSVSITDDATGKTANSIAIIDDLATQTTYVRVNGGPEQQLGQSGTILTSLSISMGVGNDKVSFSSRNDSQALYSGGDISRTVDLGAGNDTLAINLGTALNLAGASLSYIVSGDTTGSDSYSLVGAMYSGSLSFAATAETSGDDRYKIDVATTNHQAFFVQLGDAAGDDRYDLSLNLAYSGASASALVTDQSGNDVYDATLGAAYGVSLSTVFSDSLGSDRYSIVTTPAVYATNALSVSDAGSGRNSLTFARGDASYSTLSAALTFENAAANRVAIVGDAAFGSNSTAALAYTGGSAVDWVSYNDDAIGPGVTQSVSLGLGAGDDRLAARFDGRPGSTQLALGPQAIGSHSFATGEGDDLVNVALHGPALTSDASGSMGNLLSIGLDLGAGDDRAFVRAVRSPITLVGPGANLSLSVSGGADDDRIAVDLGRFGGTNGRYSVSLSGDAGADRITLDGALSNPTANYLSAKVHLGTDSVRDTFRSTLLAGAPANANDRVFEIYDYTSGVDFALLATGVDAPTWSFPVI